MTGTVNRTATSKSQVGNTLKKNRVQILLVSNIETYSSIRFLDRAYFVPGFHMLPHELCDHLGYSTEPQVSLASKDKTTSLHVTEHSTTSLLENQNESPKLGP